MKNINRNNYEIFFLDFFEGNLSSEKTEELFSFLSANQDLQKEFNEFEIVTLNKDEQQFDNKEVLKKHNFNKVVNDLNFEHFCIAYNEGDLDAGQKSGFDIFLRSNPGKRQEFLLFQRSKLLPDPAIVYFGKNKLRKGTLTGRKLLRRVSVAASLLLLAGISYFLIPGEEQLIEELIVENNQLSEINSDEPNNASFIMTERSEKLKENTIKNNAGSSGNKLTIYEDLTQVNVQEIEPALKMIYSIEPQELKALPPENLLAIAEPGIETNSSPEESKNLIDLLNRNIDELATALNTDGIDGSGRISIWDIADVGINGIGRLTGANMRLEKKRDEEGNVTALAFQSRNLNFTKKINY